MLRPAADHVINLRKIKVISLTRLEFWFKIKNLIPQSPIQRREMWMSALTTKLAVTSNFSAHAIGKLISGVNLRYIYAPAGMYIKRQTKSFVSLLLISVQTKWNGSTHCMKNC